MTNGIFDKVLRGISRAWGGSGATGARKTRKHPRVTFSYIPTEDGEVGRAAVVDRPARVYAFGSSSTEVLDYIFGPSPRYRSYWAGGWSARGLRKPANREYVMNCLRGAAQQDIIFLHYGVADAVFNAAYRMQNGQFMDPEGFCQEAADGVMQLVDDLKAAGFHNVYPLSVGAPCRVPHAYFLKQFKLYGLPVRYQAALLNRMTELMAERCELRDLTPVLADKYGVMKREFLRWHPGHHGDYVQFQKLVWEGIRDIPGLPPHRETWRTLLYRGGVRGGVAKRIKAGNFGAVDLSQFEDPSYDKPRRASKKKRAARAARRAAVTTDPKG